jgi:cell division protein FtsB
MAKQAKDQSSEGHTLEHGTVHSDVASDSPDQQTQLDELKKQYATLHALVSKLEERMAKLESPAHVERAVVKQLKHNLGISGQPARGDLA